MPRLENQTPVPEDKYVEVEINLQLLNNKLNFVITKLEEISKKLQA